MIFVDPCRFGIWVECIPPWSQIYKNGFFYFFVNGNMYPSDIRTSTLDVDFNDITDGENALTSLPCDDGIFNASKEDAFNYLFRLAYPEATQEDECPVENFDFCASITIIKESGAYFFCSFK